MPCDDGEKDKDFESNSFTHRRPFVGGKKVVVDLYLASKSGRRRNQFFFLSFFLSSSSSSSSYGVAERQTDRDRETER